MGWELGWRIGIEGEEFPKKQKKGRLRRGGEEREEVERLGIWG